jgi:hypothetical protein
VDNVHEIRWIRTPYTPRPAEQAHWDSDIDQPNKSADEGSNIEGSSTIAWKASQEVLVRYSCVKIMSRLTQDAESLEEGHFSAQELCL